MTIRVGVIGLDYGAAVHVPAYKSDPKYELVAICARTPGKAEAFARENDIPRWYTDARQLITAPLDLISIATPPSTHPGLAAAALVTGKHVVVESPFVARADDARVLKTMMREHAHLGVVAYIMRYMPLLRYVGDLLEQHLLGQPRLMRFEFFSNIMVLPDVVPLWMWDADHAGGGLASYCTHAIDLAWRWFGPVKAVEANLLTLSKPTLPPSSRITRVADDTGFVTLYFESGMLAQINYSAAVAYPQTGFEIHGSEGTLIIEGFGEQAALLKMGGDALEPIYAPMNYLEATRGQSSLMGGFTSFVDHLADTIRTGKTTPGLPTFREALEVTRIFEAINLAARERRQVLMSEIS